MRVTSFLVPFLRSPPSISPSLSISHAHTHTKKTHTQTCVCVCVWERERERESVCVCVCVCVIPKLSVWFGLVLWQINLLGYCCGVPYRWTRPHVTYTNWALFCAGSVSVLVSVRSQSQRGLSELFPRALIFLIVKLRKSFSHLSFVCVLFSFNVFLITYFCAVSSFEPPLHHNSNLMPNQFIYI